jgi:hypothetical protein
LGTPVAFAAGARRERRIDEIEVKVMITDAAEPQGTAGNQYGRCGRTLRGPGAR